MDPALPASQTAHLSTQAADPAAAIDAVYRRDARRVFATLIRLLGDFDLAEEALHEAFRAALEQWPGSGIPANPSAWLVSAGRFKATVAVAMRDGPAAGLALVNALLAQGELTNYHLAHAAQADMLRRLARPCEARAAYQRALDLAQQEPEKRFLLKRLAALG